MISFWRIFWLEALAIVRSKTLAMLLIASAGWMLVVPRFIRGDGTADGARELLVRYSLGGVFVLLAVALLAGATGTLAHERAARRLQLTLTRPVRYFALALAKMLAYVATGALVLTVSAALLAFRTDLTRPCHHVIDPVLESPRAEAARMYEVFMQDPDTPAEVKRAKRADVLRILTQRALDHYQTIPTNATVAWQFDLTRFAAAETFVRMRFTNQFEMRQDVRGEFHLGRATGVVSNITQAVLTVPLVGSTAGTNTLTFANRGATSLMLRPRKDLNLLVTADGFGRNLARAVVELTCILALLVAFGVFLSAGLGRPVALFVALAMLALSEMSPSVVASYPEEIAHKTSDRIGLALTRMAAELTHPVSSLTPLERLSKDECVEPREVARVLAVDLALMPLVLAWLSGFVLPRKQDGL